MRFILQREARLLIRRMNLLALAVCNLKCIRSAASIVCHPASAVPVDSLDSPAIAVCSRSSPTSSGRHRQASPVPVGVGLRILHRLPSAACCIPADPPRLALRHAKSFFCMHLYLLVIQPGIYLLVVYTPIDPISMICLPCMQLAPLRPSALLACYSVSHSIPLPTLCTAPH